MNVEWNFTNEWLNYALKFILKVRTGNGSSESSTDTYLWSELSTLLNHFIQISILIGWINFVHLLGIQILLAKRKVCRTWFLIMKWFDLCYKIVFLSFILVVVDVTKLLILEYKPTLSVVYLKNINFIEKKKLFLSFKYILFINSLFYI